MRLRHSFGPEFKVETVRFRGWTSLKNGELLRAAKGQFDVLVTMDNNIPDQQNLTRLSLAVAILRARSKRLDHLIELIPGLERILPGLRPGEAVRIHPPV